MRAPEVTSSEFTELLSLSLNRKPEEKMLFFPLLNSSFREIRGLIVGRRGSRSLASSAHFKAAGWLKESIGFMGCCCAQGCLVANGLPLEVLLCLDIVTKRREYNNSKAAQALFQDLCGRLGFRAVNVTWHVKSDTINTVKEPSIPTVQMGGR